MYAENETTKRNLLILIHFMSFIRCSVHGKNVLHAGFSNEIAFTPVVQARFIPVCIVSWNWIWLCISEKLTLSAFCFGKEWEQRVMSYGKSIGEANKIMIFIWMKDAWWIQAPLTSYRWTRWKFSLHSHFSTDKMQTIHLFDAVSFLFFARYKKRINLSTYN